jgi:cell wall assembly regulator SMI1
LSGSQISPIPEEDLATIEARLGRALPEDYREFLREYGGYIFIYGATFPVQTVEYGVIYASAEIFCGRMPGKIGRDLLRTYEDTLENYGEDWPVHMLPIASDAGDNDICLDMSEENKGAIYFWFRGSANPEDFSFVAPSFTEFMNLLQNDLP